MTTTVSNPRVVQHLFLVNTQVFAANTPGASAWTDLDLSAVVGARNALVVLRWQCAQGNAATFFRRRGDTDDQYMAAPTMAIGASGLRVDTAGVFGTVVVPTDSGGWIEWKSSAVTQACTIDVIAFTR